jgi:putative ABC transport system permease protein
MTMLHALRQALRSLLRKPTFTLSAVVTLALGMAATTIIFTTINHTVMRPLPFPGWERLSLVMNERSGGLMTSPPVEALAALREHATLVEGVEAWTSREFTLTGEGEPAVLAGAETTAGLPSLLSVEPILGRAFTEEEARAGARVVLLGERLWRSRFGAERTVLGRVVRLGQDSWTVVGVMPSHYSRYDNFGDPHQFWTPLRLDSVKHGLGVLVRVREGVSEEAVAAEIAAATSGLERPGSMAGAGWTMKPRSLAELAVPGLNAKRILPRLLGAAALLLLIGCANVAGLLLIRLHARARELAVRSALGARRSRLLSELALEHVLLGVAAGAMGLLLSTWGLDLIRAVRPERLAVLDNVGLNMPIVGFALTLVLVTTILFGALPAVAVLRRDLAGTLQTAGGPRMTSNTRLRSVLVSLQIALSTLLLVGGFLLVRTVHRLETADLGFDTSNTLVAELSLPRYRYARSASHELMTGIEAAIRGVDGVEAVARATGAPPQMGLTFVEQLEAEGSAAAVDDINFLSGGGISPGFFALLRARMLEGREFTSADATESVIVSRAFVERLWPGESGIGRRFRTGPTQEWRTIIGVVENLKQEGAGHSLGEVRMYWPLHTTDGGSTLLVRTKGDPRRVAPALQEIVARHDADVPIRQLSTMERRMAGTIAAHRFNLVMLALFALSAVLLCAVGLYGLMAYALQQRVREVGVRIALGASPSGVRGLFMAQAVRLTAAGVALGLAAAFASSKVTAALVHEISPRDPLAFAAALIVTLAIVLPAGWVPAGRAARVQPLDALRND